MKANNKLVTRRCCRLSSKEGGESLSKEAPRLAERPAQLMVSQAQGLLVGGRAGCLSRSESLDREAGAGRKKRTKEAPQAGHGPHARPPFGAPPAPRSGPVRPPAPARPPHLAPCPLARSPQVCVSASPAGPEKRSGGASGLSLFPPARPGCDAITARRRRRPPSWRCWAK